MDRQVSTWMSGPLKLVAVLFSMGMWIFFVVVYNAWATGGFAGANGVLHAPTQSVANTAMTFIMIIVTAVLEAITVAFIIAA